MYFTRPSEMNEYKYSKTASMLDKLVHVIRIFGVFTAIVMFGVGVDIAIHHHEFGLYIMLMSLLVFFLEITWAITLFLNVCIKIGHTHFHLMNKEPPGICQTCSYQTTIKHIITVWRDTQEARQKFNLPQHLHDALDTNENYIQKSGNEFNPIFNLWEIVLWLRLWKKSLLYTIFSLVFFLWPHGLWLSNIAGAMLLWLSFLYIVITFKDLVHKSSDFVIVPKGQASTSYDQYDDITDLLGDSIHVSLSADNLSELDQDGILEL